jgi:hypothetical protein
MRGTAYSSCSFAFASASNVCPANLVSACATFLVSGVAANSFLIHKRGSSGNGRRCKVSEPVSRHSAKGAGFPFRFSLRTLLAVTLVVSVALATRAFVKTRTENRALQEMLWSGRNMDLMLQEIVGEIDPTAQTSYIGGGVGYGGTGIDVVTSSSAIQVGETSHEPRQFAELLGIQLRERVQTSGGSDVEVSDFLRTAFSTDPELIGGNVGSAGCANVFFDFKGARVLLCLHAFVVREHENNKLDYLITYDVTIVR